MTYFDMSFDTVQRGPPDRRGCLTETHRDCEIGGTVVGRWILRRNPVLVNDGDLEEVHLEM